MVGGGRSLKKMKETKLIEKTLKNQNVKLKLLAGEDGRHLYKWSCDSDKLLEAIMHLEEIKLLFSEKGLKENNINYKKAFLRSLDNNWSQEANEASQKPIKAYDKCSFFRFFLTQEDYPVNIFVHGIVFSDENEFSVSATMKTQKMQMNSLFYCGQTLINFSYPVRFKNPIEIGVTFLLFFPKKQKTTKFVYSSSKDIVFKP